MSFSQLDSEGNSSGESLVKMCITLTDMSLKSALRITKSDCLMCYDVNRYNTLHSISIAQNNKALCLQFTVQRFVLSCACFQYFLGIFLCCQIILFNFYLLLKNYTSTLKLRENSKEWPDN